MEKKEGSKTCYDCLTENVFSAMIRGRGGEEPANEGKEGGEEEEEEDDYNNDSNQREARTRKM